MLGAANRLRTRRDIDRVYKKGSYGSGEGFISLKAAPGHAELSRAVIVVSKKVDKRAVVRNTIRRRLAASLAGIWATVPTGYDIVISVHRDTRELTPAKLTQLLTDSLRRARINLH